MNVALFFWCDLDHHFMNTWKDDVTNFRIEIHNSRNSVVSAFESLHGTLLLIITDGTWLNGAVLKSFSQEIKQGLVICSDKEWLIQISECCFSESELKLESKFYHPWHCPWTFICLMEMLGWIRSACLETSQANLAFGSRQSTAFLAKENKRGCWPSRFKCYLLLFPPNRFCMKMSSYKCSCKGSSRCCISILSDFPIPALFCLQNSLYKWVHVFQTKCKSIREGI